MSESVKWADRLVFTAWARGGWWGRYRFDVRIVDRTEDLGFVCSLRCRAYLWGRIPLPFSGFACWKPVQRLTEAEDQLTELCDQVDPWLGDCARQAISTEQ